MCFERSLHNRRTHHFSDRVPLLFAPQNTHTLFTMCTRCAPNRPQHVLFRSETRSTSASLLANITAPHITSLSLCLCEPVCVRFYNRQTHKMPPRHLHLHPHAPTLSAIDSHITSPHTHTQKPLRMHSFPPLTHCCDRIIAHASARPEQMASRLELMRIETDLKTCRCAIPIYDVMYNMY